MDRAHYGLADAPCAKTARCRRRRRDGRIVLLDPYTSQRDESAELRAKQARAAIGWSAGMTTDIFG